MLAIRLRRTGSKKRPVYRVVVADSRSPRDGRFVEVLGYYNPRTSPETMRVDRARWEHWLRAGAQPSDTVRTLMDRVPAEPQGEGAAAGGGAAGGGEQTPAAQAAP